MEGNQAILRRIVALSLHSNEKKSGERGKTMRRGIVSCLSRNMTLSWQPFSRLRKNRRTLCERTCSVLLRSSPNLFLSPVSKHGLRSCHWRRVFEWTRLRTRSESKTWVIWHHLGSWKARFSSSLWVVSYSPERQWTFAGLTEAERNLGERSIGC